MQVTSSGRDFFIYTLTLNSTSDTTFSTQTGYTPATAPSGYVFGQVMNATSFLIRSRSAIDLQFRKTANSTEFFTIPSGTTFTFDISPANSQQLFFLRSASATPIAEILVMVD